MPIDLPNLDDRRYSDLVEEALRMIPAHAPEWTHHNPSDPGITLIETFAYLTEILIYRLNRVTPEATLAFLKLINGPEWMPCRPEREAEAWSELGLRDRDTEIREWWRACSIEERGRILAETVRQLRKPRRAVASADFQTLARAVDKRVARVHCIPGNGDGHIRVIVVPGPFSTPLTPKQAAGRKGKVVTVQFTVKGDRSNNDGPGYTELYSEDTWNHPDTFFVRLPPRVRDQLVERGIHPNDLTGHFRGKEIHVTGTVEFVNFSKGDFPVIVVEDLEHLNIAFQVPDKLKKKIEDTLRLCCLLATQIDVEGPKLAGVSARLTLVLESDTPEQDARTRADSALQGFLDPLTWPFGQAIYPSKLTALFADLPGIRDVRDITLTVIPEPPVTGPVTGKIVAIPIDPDTLAFPIGADRLAFAKGPMDITIARVGTIKRVGA